MVPVTTRVAVAAPNAASTGAALRVAELGGGAVDSAVAAMLVAMVNEPGIVSLAGGAYVTVWPAGSAAAVTVDGYVSMPGLDRPRDAPTPVAREVRTGYGGGVTMTAGHASVATPGALAGLDLAQSRYGTLPWREVVAPAEAVARAGFSLGPAAGYYLPYVKDSLLAWDLETATSLLGTDGRVVTTGDRMVVPGLADSLSLVAVEGASALYTGELGRRLAADMIERGGLVTEADLRAYRPVVRPALTARTGPWALRTNPPPAIGGAVLAAMLELFGERPGGPWSENDVAHLVRVQRRILDVRRHRLDLVAHAADRESAALEMLREVGWQAPGPPSTAHVSVVDAEGNACAVTASYGYGSGVTVPGTGLWLNNCLGELELNRGAPLQPGERLRSNMAPTVGRHDDGSVLAVGTPGADRITTALLQVLAAFAGGGTTLQEAVDRPRLHVHHLDDGDPDGTARVDVEDDLPLPTLDLPIRRHPPRSMYFGGVGAAMLDAGERLQAAGDPRRAGAVAVSD